MIDALRDAEQAKYAAIWQRPDYRLVCHGLRLWQEHRSIFPERVESAVDIGCGTGRLFEQWCDEGIDGYGVDLVASIDPAHRFPDRLTTACLWDMQLPRRFDLGVCADVMEHIPPERVDDVLERIADCCDAAVLQIANYPSSFGDEGPLHLTLQPAEWWLAAIRRHGRAEYLPTIRRPGVEEYVFRLIP